MTLGLRICVNTLQGATQGVPAILRLLDEYQLRGSFFFATGPDKSGRLIDTIRQPWYPRLNPASRLYGIALFPPRISKRAAEIMRSVAAAGHETGILCHDRAYWLNQLAHAPADRTRQELNQAMHDFEAVFGKPPRCMAAAGWQTNPHLLQLQQEYGFDYASDVRGKSAFYPELQGVISTCPQLPTTLPTISEQLQQGGAVTPDNVHEYLYAESQHILPQGHVFSCDAETEGLSRLGILEKLLVMWKGREGGVLSLRDLLDDEIRPQLKQHHLGWAPEASGRYYYATQSLAV
jgi:undecaprenyl phosphate-alpha-L-ara4FN deformylase